jgi:hypothetical protein
VLLRIDGELLVDLLAGLRVGVRVEELNLVVEDPVSNT